MAHNSYTLRILIDERVIKNGKCPMYVRITVNRKKAELALHEWVAPAKFNKAVGRIANPTRYERYLNEKLNHVENELNTIQCRWHMEQRDRAMTAKAIKEVYKNGSPVKSPGLLEFFDKQVQEMVGREQHAENTMKHYTISRDKLHAYLSSIDSVGIELNKFSLKHVDGFYKFMERTVSTNTVINNMKKLRAIMSAAVKNELLVSNPFSNYRMAGVESNRVALTYKEIQAIQAHPLANDPTLIKIRDLWMFSVYTGLSYTDVFHLKSENIHADGDRLWLSINRRKTQRAVNIPMLAPAKAIYDKYQGYREATGRVLPMISNSKINVHLKNIGIMVGILKPLSHHVARHTYATTILLENGTDIYTVKEMLGHYSIRSTEGYSKTTRKILIETADKIDKAL